MNELISPKEAASQRKPLRWVLMATAGFILALSACAPQNAPVRSQLLLTNAPTNLPTQTSDIVIHSEPIPTPVVQPPTVELKPPTVEQNFTAESSFKPELITLVNDELHTIFVQGEDGKDYILTACTTTQDGNLSSGGIEILIPRGTNGSVDEDIGTWRTPQCKNINVQFGDQVNFQIRGQKGIGEVFFGISPADFRDDLNLADSRRINETQNQIREAIFGRQTIEVSIKGKKLCVASNLVQESSILNQGVISGLESSISAITGNANAVVQVGTPQIIEIALGIADNNRAQILSVEPNAVFRIKLIADTTDLSVFCVA